MVYGYEELARMDKKELIWDNVSKEQLEKLFYEDSISDGLIAELYNVSKSKVRSKRYKYDIKWGSTSHYKNIYKDVMKDKQDIENRSKEYFCNKDNINEISRVITHYIFRLGPIEKMHADGGLSQEDMKILNKFMMNRIGTILKIALDGEWTKLLIMVEYLKKYGSDWDCVEYATLEFDELLKRQKIG